MTDKITIRNRWDGGVLYEGEHETLREAAEASYDAGACLAGADLAGADLKYADLLCFDFRGADLRNANLRNADLRHANLAGADLRGANLAGAYLRNTDLRNADLRHANLPPAPVVKNIDAAILDACNDGEHLNMATWHCGTTHCRAGRAVTLAGDAGRALENKIGTNAAAALIYAASTPGGCVVPDWFASKENALADMRARAKKEPSNEA